MRDREADREARRRRVKSLIDDPDWIKTVRALSPESNRAVDNVLFFRALGTDCRFFESSIDLLVYYVRKDGFAEGLESESDPITKTVAG